MRRYIGTLTDILLAVRLAAMDHVICGLTHGRHVCTKPKGHTRQHECVLPESITMSAMIMASWTEPSTSELVKHQAVQSVDAVARKVR